jgi:hypothetical protein
MEKLKNEVALVEEKKNLMTASQGQEYYSIQPKNREESILVYNAINSPDFRVADYINKTIEVKEILIENVELVNEKTGQLEIVPRTVLIDPKGKSYVAVSFGIFNSIKRVVQMFGEPNTWGGTPVKVEVKQIKKGENSILTLTIVG